MTSKQLAALYNGAPKHVRAIVQVVLDPTLEMRRECWPPTRMSIRWDGQRFYSSSIRQGFTTPTGVPEPGGDWIVQPRQEGVTAPVSPPKG